MSYPPVPYPTITPVEQVSSQQTERAKTSESLDQSSTPRSSIRSSHQLSQPFRSPRRCPPRSAPDPPSPTPVFRTLAESSAAFLKHLMELESWDSENVERESPLSLFPGTFEPFRTPKREKKTSSKRGVDNGVTGDSQGGSKRRKQKSRDEDEDGETAARNNEAASDSENDSTTFEPLAKLASFTPSSPSPLPCSTERTQERLPFRAPRRRMSLEQSRKKKESSIHSKSRKKTSRVNQYDDDDDSSDDDILVALDRIIQSQILPAESKAKKLQERILSREKREDSSKDESRVGPPS
ncbi:hypothetical protein JCM5350_007030 [Sporobolomyces pararoseus]